jgi:thioredoxin reductase
LGWLRKRFADSKQPLGDVRFGSVKRVASAVGEGAMAMQFVEEYLKEM